jgi:hypothetical protein
MFRYFPRKFLILLPLVIDITTGAQENAGIQRIEYFVDSLHIGIPKQNKVELSRYQNEDTSYVTVKFFSWQKDKKWRLIQSFSFEKTGPGANPKLSDFNNDGYNDLTYNSLSAARGANDIRKLFVYNKKLNKLVCMRNSEDYPNMLYNKELNCIDAFLVHGGSSTVFLHISGDRFIEFARVDLSDDLVVYEIDKNGKEKELKRQPTEWRYVRFKNYKTLQPYDDY